MEQIKIMNAYEAYKGVFGRVKYIYFLYFIIPLALIFLVVGGLIGLFFVDDMLAKFLGPIFFVAAIIIFQFFVRERNYRPGKSYYLFRGSREGIMKKQIYLAIAAIILCSVIAFYDYINYGKIKHVLQLGFVIIGGGYYFYNMKKSFKVHEDVDFATSSEMESLVGVEVGEKIQATYQNFDSSAGEELKDGASLMLVSDKRIYFSYVENGEWSFMRKNLNEIVKMAIVGDGNNEYKSYLKLVFSDETRIVLALEDFEKMTSNKLLFLKKFLDVLDAVALGTVDEKISSRRRISVGQGTKSVDSQQKENRETRSIDLGEGLMDKLKNATPVESGRVLEL